MVALDTNTVIHYFKGMGRVAERLVATPPALVGAPSVVLYELEVGALKASQPEARRAQIHALMSHVALLPFGEKEARVAEQVRATLEAEGQPIGPLDTLIAATALTHDATLITRNVREFSRVAGLRLESWFD